ncbi:hypothetical protein LTR28_003118 [Elasticomyces elasticus]|nr:hypothetical protein LTR28_003118 [Elasticomyces elasticus]
MLLVVGDEAEAVLDLVLATDNEVELDLLLGLDDDTNGVLLDLEVELREAGLRVDDVAEVDRMLPVDAVDEVLIGVAEEETTTETLVVL